MKTWRVFLAILAVLVAAVPVMTAQKPANQALPKYDKGAEAVFKGTVEQVKDRECPVSGGMGSHLILKLADGTWLIGDHVAQCQRPDSLCQAEEAGRLL